VPSSVTVPYRRENQYALGDELRKAGSTGDRCECELRALWMGLGGVLYFFSLSLQGEFSA